MIRQSILLVVVLLALAYSFPKVKRQAGQQTYDLPSGAELIVGQIRSTFSCDNRQYGYYADEDNNCQIFHVCVPIPQDDGTTQSLMYSFFCGNQTVFDQSQLVCTYPEDAIPCSETRNWIYLNDFFGNLEKEFYPRKAIPDEQPQGSVASAPVRNFISGKRRK